MDITETDSIKNGEDSRKVYIGMHSDDHLFGALVEMMKAFGKGFPVVCLGEIKEDLSNGIKPGAMKHVFNPIVDLRPESFSSLEKTEETLEYIRTKCGRGCTLFSR